MKIAFEIPYVEMNVGDKESIEDLVEDIDSAGICNCHLPTLI